MYRLGFIMPESILNDAVPVNFIEGSGLFKDYLREYYVKDGRVLFHLNRGKVYYYPSQVEQDLWTAYFGEQNKVDFFNELPNFKEIEYEEDI